jgi:uncharacterized protein involved in exopolysaccharide biosynthesis
MAAIEEQRRALADDLQRAQVALRDEEARIDSKRAGLNSDIERAQRAQSAMMKTSLTVNRLTPAQLTLLTPVERSQFGF